MLPRRSLLLLSALYFSQGLPFGFQASALPVYLRVQGTSLTAIGFAGVLALPWALKALWAPWVDRHRAGRFGPRKSWILPLQLGLALTSFAAALLPEGQLVPLLALIFLMNLLAATQDIATDGLAVDLLEGGGLGWGNTTQVVGYKIGMLAGGGLLVWAAGKLGWPFLFGAMGVLHLIALVLTLTTPEPGTSAETREPIALKEILVRMLAILRAPGVPLTLLFVGTYKLGESMIDSMFKPFLVDAKFPVETIGLWVGTWGLVAGLLGSLAGGWLSTRVALLKAVAIAAVLRVIPLVGVWALASFGPEPQAVLAVTLAEHFFGSVLTVAMFAWMMSSVDPRIGATHFTLLASIEVLGKSPGSWAAGPIAERFGYPTVFAVGTLASLAFLLLLVPLARRPRPELEPRPSS